MNHQGFYFAVFPSVGGRQFEADNIDQMEAVGRYLGRMHQTGRKQLFIHRPTIGLNEYLIEPRKLFEDATLIPSGLKAAVMQNSGIKDNPLLTLSGKFVIILMSSV